MTRGDDRAGVESEGLVGVVGTLRRGLGRLGRDPDEEEEGGLPALEVGGEESPAPGAGLVA